MRRQQGFTLIELVVVIIILGILAVTAAPKFINLQGDARASTLQGLKGSLQGANTLVYSKAALAGLEKKAFDAVPAHSIDIGTGTPVVTHYGYLQSTQAQLSSAVDLALSDDEDNASDWYIAEGTSGSAASVIYQAGSARFGNTTTTSNRCYLTYTPATETTVPTYVITDDDC
ncbi:prepilin-type N-terminal cleavage/methylation domain-containing protein [Shewanella profunda]|uniref:type II secretion system protein n=1 Tax=Shewanella profunda TaxID=254793 RepID=UPI00200C4E86|nr:prepilin-type N-terminal cleavage/methylation domain-containing protein [Shewanella profunda]MCL1089003.1 prepilin-type N-terminal cleavage/methylation domain-containing protein [Shewanella profunda]